MTTACVDTNVLVALADARDKWHVRAVALRDALLAGQTSVVYFDCVVNEAIGVIGRRAEEQGRSEQFSQLVDRLLAIVPESSITWIAPLSQTVFGNIIELCRLHHGKINFHDALMALACQELGISVIVSFDADFDEISWLQRISDADRAQKLLVS